MCPREKAKFRAIPGALYVILGLRELTNRPLENTPGNRSATGYRRALYNSQNPIAQ
jgi:hypothetical protein